MSSWPSPRSMISGRLVAHAAIWVKPCHTTAPSRSTHSSAEAVIGVGSYCRPRAGMISRTASRRRCCSSSLRRSGTGPSCNSSGVVPEEAVLCGLEFVALVAGQVGVGVVGGAVFAVGLLVVHLEADPVGAARGGAPEPVLDQECVADLGAEAATEPLDL